MTFTTRCARCAALLAAGFVSLSLASCGGGKSTAHEEGAEAAAHADEHGTDAHGDDHAAAKDDGHAKADTHGAKDAKHGAAKDSGHGKAAGHGKAESHGAAQGGHGKAATKRVYQPGDTVEVDLGEFTVTQRQTEQNAILLIHFQIFGVVDHGKREQFEKLLEDRRQRLRDSVITIVQRADSEQLGDPGLGWLKSEIIPAVNKLLKTRLLKDVVFSDFAMVQN